MTRTKSKPKIKRPATQPVAAGSSSQLSGPEVSSPSMTGISPSTEVSMVSTTVKLDMLTDHAFNNIIRILHRHGSPNLRTSLMPIYPKDLLYGSSPTSSRPTSPPTPSTPGVQRNILLPLEYPTWRVGLLVKAKKAGIGAISSSMEKLMFDEGFAESSRSDGDTERKRRDTIKIPATAVRSEPVSPTANFNYFSSDGTDSDGGTSEKEFADWTLDPALMRLSSLSIDDRDDLQMDGITSRFTNDSSHSPHQLSHPPSADSLRSGRPRGLTTFAPPPRNTATSSSSSDSKNTGSVGRKRSATTVSPKSSDASISSSNHPKRPNLLTRIISNDRFTKIAASGSSNSDSVTTPSTPNTDTPSPVSPAMRRVRSGTNLSGTGSSQSGISPASSISLAGSELSERDADARARARVWQRNQQKPMGSGRTPIELTFPF